MDLLLVEGDAARSQSILNRLGHGPQRVVCMGEAPFASGAFFPRHDLTAGVLLGFEEPSIDKVRVLKRLWASDCCPPSFIITLPGSPGERLLDALLCGPTIRGDWSVRGLRPASAPGFDASFHITKRINVRSTATLSLERMMAVERVVAGASRSANQFLREAA